MAARFQFPCPNCGTTLRLRDRKLVGRTLPCPDCQTELALVDDRGGIKAVADGDVLATLSKPSGSPKQSAVASGIAGAAATTGAPTQSVASTSVANLTSSAVAKGKVLVSTTQPMWTAIATPVGIGWTVAGSVAAVLLGSIRLGSDDSESSEGPDVVDVAPVETDKGAPAACGSPSTSDDAMVGGEDAPSVAMVDPDNIALTPEAAGLTPVSPTIDQGPTAAFPEIPPPSPAVAPKETPTAEQPATEPNPPKPNSTPTANQSLPPTDKNKGQARPAEPKPASVPEDVAAATPKEPEVDIQAALSQTLSEYRLAKPVPVRALLIELESMVGVPISIDTQRVTDAEAAMSRPVLLSLKSTTVGEVLAASLEPSGLAYKAGNAEIVIVPASDK